ncbi:hypothetical protein Tco_1340221 [Tanacetum coccineum]
MPTNVLIAAVEAAENILPVAAHKEAKTIHNMTTENKLYFQAEKEAIFLILTGIGDEIYSTLARASAGTSFNGQKQQRIDITADALYNEKQENLRVWLLKFLISKKPVPEWFHKR